MPLNIQAPVLGLILLWSGLIKVLSPEADAFAISSALARLVRRVRITLLLYRALGTVEVLVAGLVIAPPYQRWEIYMVWGLTLGFVLFLIWAKRTAPDKPCGCLGVRETPVTWKSLLRAALLLLMSSAALYGAQYWLDSLQREPLWLTVIAAEVGVILYLSPEIDWEFLVQHLKRQSVFVEQAGNLDCTMLPTPPFTKTLAHVLRIRDFRRLEHCIKGGLADQWREGCWHYFSFDVEYQGQQGQLVIAAPLVWDANRVRVVIVDQEASRTLLQDPQETTPLSFAPTI
jgi:hypothetical protein